MYNGACGGSLPLPTPRPGLAQCTVWRACLTGPGQTAAAFGSVLKSKTRLFLSCLGGCGKNTFVLDLSKYGICKDLVLHGDKLPGCCHASKLFCGCSLLEKHFCWDGLYQCNTSIQYWKVFLFLCFVFVGCFLQQHHTTSAWIC